jgi:hypothetical protein
VGWNDWVRNVHPGPYPRQDDPVTIQSWGALDFFREILKKDPADVSALFELWAVNQE